MFKGTTIIAVRDKKSVVIAGDGQVTLGHTVMKGNARKLRVLGEGRVIAGFAGSTSDAVTLYEIFEEKLKRYNYQTRKAAVELSKTWRKDRVLGKLEAMMIVSDKEDTLLISGSGDILEPEKDIPFRPRNGQNLRFSSADCEKEDGRAVSPSILSSVPRHFLSVPYLRRLRTWV